MNEAWEYRTISPPLPEIFGHLDYAALVRIANVIGAEGWEMVGYGANGFWFKRRVVATTAPPAGG